MNVGNIFSPYLEKSPNKIAVICDEQSLTYKELEVEIIKFMKILDFFNIKKGDKVSFLIDNNLFLVAAFLGCYRMGVVAVPSSIYSSAKELETESKSCGSKIYFTIDKFHERLLNIKEDSPTVENVVVIDKKVSNGDFFLLDLYEKTENLLIKQKSLDLSPQSEAIILYTSGSTGLPKGVTHTHNSLMASAKYRMETLQNDETDRIFTVTHLAHAAASVVILLPMLLAGGTAIYTNKHSTQTYIDIIREHKVTHFAATPKDWKNLLQSKNILKEDFKYLKFAFSGGDAVPIELQKSAQSFLDIPLAIGLGMTECGGYMTTPPSLTFKLGSLGKPIKHVKVQLVDDALKEVKQGETGEILVKSDMTMAYYYKDEENTKKVLVDGWFLTGDLAYKDEDGYYFFQGRKKNIILKDYMNINPVEVEYALNKHPDIASVIVFGVKDEERGEKVVACIVPNKEDHSLEENVLVEFLHSKIAERKIPDYFMFFDTFPSDTTLGKVNIKKLKEIVNENFAHFK